VILESGAKLTAVWAGARSGIDLGSRGDFEFALLHLTRNKGPIIKGKVVQTRADFLAIRAISITGTVLVNAPSLSDIESRLEFHLIQLVYPVTDQASYAGRTAADGSMVLNFDKAPGKPAGYLLDSTADALPNSESWAARVDQVAPGMWQVKVELHDHPHT